MFLVIGQSKGHKRSNCRYVWVRHVGVALALNERGLNRILPTPTTSRLVTTFYEWGFKIRNGVSFAGPMSRLRQHFSRVGIDILFMQMAAWLASATKYFTAQGTNHGTDRN